MKLERELNRGVYLKDYDVQTSSLLYRHSILIKFSKDLNLERREGCFDLSRIKPIIWQGVRAGFFLSIRDLAREGNWEKIAEIIPQDLNINFNLETEQPLTSPLFT
ncbi:hypothetical protein E3J85_00180 [Patescibacteria group bacterium]|nr:MAG: hypothetical protein E3J85_00180 [Patescibacteria group bacterium]